MKYDVDPKIYFLLKESFGNDLNWALDTFYCESGLKHFNKDGTVLIGRITPDVGITQISPKYWDKELKEKGFDYWTLEGNIKAAKYILDKSGKNAWVCHQNRIR